jgi:2-C-methyl-D-erythritol 4-phosphate cytidylyltransferase
MKVSTGNPVSAAAVISAAGSSSRMGGVKKEYLPLPPVRPGENPRETLFPLTVLGAAVSAFASCPRIGLIVITVPPDGENGESAARSCLPPGLLSEAGHGRVLFVSGGATRRRSVHNALKLLDSRRPTHVLIHDGARPWITRDLIERIIEAVIRHGAVIPALPSIETPKELNGVMETKFPGNSAAPEDKPVFIKRHLRRAELCAAQTPQAFKFPEILRAHERAAEREERGQFEYTDDAEVWGEFIGQVAVIPGDPGNRKITFPEDLKMVLEINRGDI